PDSRFIGFLVGGKVMKIEAAGGPPQTLCEVPGDLIGGSWNRDGVIIFGTPDGGLFRVSQAGGVAARLTTSDEAHGELGHGRPWFLPDGRHYLYFSRTDNPEAVGIYLATLDGTERKRLVATNHGGAYAPPAAGSENGHLLFLRGGTLMALPLDARRFEPVGEPFPLAEQVGSMLATEFFSVSANGVLAYRNGSAIGGGGSQLVWFDRQGKSLGTLGPPGSYGGGPTLSPDGNRAAVDQGDAAGNRNVWVLDVARGVPTRFTFDSGQDFSPAWSPDGTRLVFGSFRGAGAAFGIYQRDSSGTGKEELLLQSSLPMDPNSWSPDGRYLLYSTGNKSKRDLWVLPATARTPPGSKPTPYLQGPYNEQQGQFSPDGHWIAYSSDETGSYQVYVQSFPAGAAKVQVSTAGGSQPRWRRDGKEIFYISADARLTAVAVKTEPRFEAGAPHALFDVRTPAGPLIDWFSHYDVAVDGKRFLVNTVATGSAASAPTPITVIVNWPAALKR
ncbi:MAG TPA: hypothetical protein VNY05_18605, partial [Candidatus Acidoferrales bacterium]|nr:hypothetical protein [Candidatus Acidoferrales bacterium]